MMVSDNEEKKVLVVLVEEEKKDQMTMNKWIEEEELEKVKVEMKECWEQGSNNQLREKNNLEEEKEGEKYQNLLYQLY